MGANLPRQWLPLATQVGTERVIGQVRSGLAAACIGVSLFSDLDFAIKPFVGRSYHHYFTHSLGFAAIFAVVVYLLARALKRSRPLWETGALTAVFFLA